MHSDSLPKNHERMKKLLNRIPKTSVATIIGAILTYSQAKGYVGGDEAVLISQILVACGIVINVISKR